VASPTILPNLWAPIFQVTSTGTSPNAAGLLRATRVNIPNAMKTVQIDVSTGGATSFRVGVYTDTPTGPGTLVAQTVDMSGVTAAVVASALAVPAGVCWMALQNVGGASATLRVATGANPLMIGGDAPGSNTINNQWQATGQGSVMPGTFPAPTSRAGQFPLMFVQAT